MTYAIVYSSKTGNTKRLADAIRAALPAEAVCYCGAPDAAALAADTLFVGFWTDKGSCDAETAAFLKTLSSQRLFLFGTCGFGGDDSYFDRILDNASSCIPAGVPVIGRFMCQGKMPQGVRKRYERTAAEDPGKRPLMTQMIANFDAALSHPDDNDLARLTAAVEAVL